MTNSCIYLDTYILQQDMRVRMPKAILTNLGVEKGETKFDVYLDREDKSIILKIHEDKQGGIEANE